MIDDNHFASETIKVTSREVLISFILELTHYVQNCLFFLPLQGLL